MADPRRLSKTLSYWLRHAPDAGGLVLDAGGWAPSADVLAALGRAGIALDAEGLARTVAQSDKNRFELSADGARLRARQGHSITVEGAAVEGDWSPAEPPPLLFHGTVERFLPAILEQGLVPGRRHHVHLSPDTDTATRVGARRGEAVVLEVAAGAMAADGAAFLVTGNGVWLVDRVPPRFLQRVG